MDEIIRFVSLAQTDRFTITEPHEQFNIRRKRACKHLERYADGEMISGQCHRRQPRPGKGSPRQSWHCLPRGAAKRSGLPST